jgi:hypothetical protein
MTCMLWDIEAGVRVVEFSDHTGDVMRYALYCIAIPMPYYSRFST